MDYVEPVGPWFINVVHFVVGGRPWCCSPVDYNVVEWSDDWAEINCAACYRARGEYEEQYG